MTRYWIQIGRRRTYFQTLDAATTFAQAHFERTGHILGIQKETS